ncbi:MAG: GAF domain-containing SpoIIE family protein phosphatase [Rhodomicrobium sp.]
MPSFPIPVEEAKRLRELHSLRFTEWDAGAALNVLCDTAARLLETPIAHLSLVGRDEQIFAGKTGLEADWTARAVAFCAHTIMTPEPFIIENAEKDPRFCNNPLVTADPNIRAYLGIPLETEPGLRIGALCAVDRKPRAFTKNDVETLTRLARIAASMLQSYRATLVLNDQLANAIALQNEMLPSNARIERIQESCPLDLASYYKARDGIGGDIWGIEATTPQRLLLYVVDFTGHGLAAALNTARFHSFAHMAAQRTDKPGSMLRRLNERLHEVLPVGQFATMFCATLDFAAQTMEYASAGAPPQLYRRSSSEPFELLEKPGLPLGILRNTVFESETVPFEPGGTLVLYTDGLTETPRPPHPTFTSDALKRFLNASPGGGALEIRNQITNALFFNPSIEVDDDLTLIVAKHTGEGTDPSLDYEV